MTKRSFDAAGIKSEPKLFVEICAIGLRKGKWTDEEEKYASTIIAHFENNLLPLSEQRESTIRLYLGKQLHCDPMRISKKFAGNNSVGKHFFCKKQEDGQIQTAQALDLANLEREQQRQIFVESVEKEFEAASKRPKRIRIRNRKKKPKGMEATPFRWDGEFSDDDLGDLEILLDSKTKEKDAACVEDGFVVTPCGSPNHTAEFHHPLTPPTGPVQVAFEHDNFVLDCVPVRAPINPVFMGAELPKPPPTEFSGLFVEPPALCMPPHMVSMPSPVMNVNVPYGYTMVVCGPSQPQPWACAPVLPYRSVQAACPGDQQVFKEQAFDARLDYILSCKEGADGYDFLDSI